MYKNHFLTWEKLLPVPVLIITLLAYCNSLKNGFVYDDQYFIVDNIEIRSLSNFTRFFTDPENTVASRPWEGIYRPLRTLSYALDYKTWGLNPLGYHVTNLLIHLVNVFLVYKLLLFLFQDKIKSSLGSLVFGIHPVQTESVAWISSRAELLYTFFGILVILSVLKRNQKLFEAGFTRSKLPFLNILLPPLFFIMALLSKETAVVIPFILVTFLICADNNEPVLKTLNKSRLPLLTMAILSVIYLVTRFSMFSTVSQQQWWGKNVYWNMFTSTKVFFLYVKLLFFPIELNVDHRPSIVQHPLNAMFLTGLVLFMSVSYLILRGTFKQKLWGPGLAWFIAGLLPVMNIIPIKTLMAERFLYFPICGLIIAWVDILKPRNSSIISLPTGRKIIYTLVATVLALMFVGTLARNFDWKNGITIWSASIKEDPGNSRAYFGYGFALAQDKKFSESIEYYNKSISLDPTHPEPYFHLGLVHEHMGNISMALQNYFKSYSLQPGNPELLYNIGNIYMELKQFTNSKHYFEKALSIFPAYVQVLNNLGLVEEKIGNFEVAREKFISAININPSFIMPYNNLGTLLARQGLFEEAEEIFKKGLTIDPGNRTLRRNLKILYDEMNK